MFEYNDTAYLSFYDEERILIFDIKTYDKTRFIETKEAFVSFVCFKPDFLICSENSGFI